MKVYGNLSPQLHPDYTQKLPEQLTYHHIHTLETNTYSESHKHSSSEQAIDI